MDKYYPYNAINGDRKHDADDIARIIGAVITTGIAMAPSNSLQVLAGGDFKVTVKAGICVIDGHIGINDNDKTFTIAAPSAGANRIDRIIARADYTNRVNSILYVLGTPASSPQPPSLANSTTARDITLARIYVGQTASSIIQSAITDERTACGLAAPSPIDALMIQFRDSFNTWMNGQETTFQSWANRVQAALESTEAGQVLSLITQLQTGKQDALSASNPLPLASGGLGGSAAGLDEARALIGAWAKPTLLWTNGSPTSTFAKQTIVSTWIPYPAYLVEYTVYIAQVQHRCIAMIPKETQMSPFHYLGAFKTHYWRYVVINQYGAYFDPAWYVADNGSPVEDNTIMIPYKIWGVKEVTP